MEIEGQGDPSKQFRMLKPKVLKTILQKALAPGITSIVLFSNIEGSIIAKVGEDSSIHSQAAVLANICHEYIEFGQEAFKNNNLQTLFLSIDNVHYVCKPIYNLILCFICKKDVNLGLIRSKIDVLAECLEKGLEKLKDHLISY